MRRLARRAGAERPRRVCRRCVSGGRRSRREPRQCRPSAGPSDRRSQRHHPGFHCLPNPLLEVAERDEVDRAPEDGLEVVTGPSQVDETHLSRPVARKIEVAVGPVLAPGDAAEHREAADAMGGRQVQESSSVVTDALTDGPRQSIQPTWSGTQVQVQLVTRSGDKSAKGGEGRLSTAGFVGADDALCGAGSISELGLSQVCSASCFPQQDRALHAAEYSGSSLSCWPLAPDGSRTVALSSGRGNVRGLASTCRTPIRDGRRSYHW